MELISNYEESSKSEVVVASLDGYVVFKPEPDSGMVFLRKPHGSVYLLNDKESSNPIKFLEKVKEYNL